MTKYLSICKKKGWKVGDIDEFLDLGEAEMAIIKMKVALAKALVEKGRRRTCRRRTWRKCPAQTSPDSPKWRGQIPTYP